MQTRIKLVIAALAAAALMLLAVSSASARRIELNEQNFLTAWETASPLTFTASSNVIRCPVTLDGSFHSKTLSKVCGQLIGYINRAIVPGNCTGGSARALTETLPWHIRYFSFSGTLPEITLLRIMLIGARFQVRTSGGLTCLAGTTAEHPGVANINIEEEGGPFRKATNLVALPEFTIPLGGGFVCEIAGESHFEGTAAVTGSAAERPRILLKLGQ